ncbi:hypothetical protein PENTCL1PPCAC_13523, partial [Pristionchus entomophagus]
RYLSRVPYSFEFDGAILPGFLLSSEKIRSLHEFQLGADDVVIASYPKSGTTWASEVLSAIAHEGDIELLTRIKMEERVCWLELDARRLSPNSILHLPYSYMDSSSAKKRVWFTHLPVQHLPPTIREGKCKLLYVARNPKDQAVSYFHFHRSAAFLGQQTDLTFDEFFRLFCSGCICLGSWFEHVLGYWKFIQNNQQAKFICYEDMKRDLMAEMESIEGFVGVPLSLEQRAAVVEHCSFQSMKDNKMTNRDGLPMVDNKVSKFMRKGVVGDWKNHFTVAQNEAFDAIYKSEMEKSGLMFEFE